MFNVRSRGQSTLEYVILIGFVVAALIAMGVYMKRGAEGRLRESTDQVGEQYEAGRTTGTYRTTSNLKQTATVLPSGESGVYYHMNTQAKTGNETVVALNAI